MANPIVLTSDRSDGANPQSIYSVSTTKHFALGTKGVLGDRVFYYASHVGAGLTIGNLCARAAAVANHINVAWASGGASDTNSVTVTLGATSAAANLYQEGYLAPTDGTGSGQLRLIKANSSGSASGTLSVTTYDPFTISCASGAEFSLVKNRYDSIIVTPGDAVVSVIGAPQVTIPDGSTTTRYFWLQTWGPALVVGNDTTFADGSMVAAATATTADAGQCTLVAGTASNASVVPQVVIGTIIEKGSAASDGDYRFVDLSIRA